MLQTFATSPRIVTRMENEHLTLRPETSYAVPSLIRKKTEQLSATVLSHLSDHPLPRHDVGIFVADLVVADMVCGRYGFSV